MKKDPDQKSTDKVARLRAKPMTKLPLGFCLFLILLLSAAPVPYQAKGQTKPTYRDKTPSDFASQAREYMNARARVTGFSGAVLVARKGRTVFRSGYGLANHEFGIPNTPTIKFRLASAGKQFTAAAILLLEQRGKLKVADPVGAYLPNWPKAWEEATIHHLLSHTAGLPRLTTQALMDVSALTRSTVNPFRGVRDLLKPGEDLQPLDSKPGEKFAYSNVGYIVLSMIVEKASGRSFCDFVSGEIFQPLGMINTGCENPDMILKQRANGYVRISETLANAPYVDMRFANGGGSIYSTLDDLLLWDRALYSNRFLQADATERLFAPVRNEYAYGWWVQTKFNRKVEWHGGNVSGFVSQITRYPSEQLFIAVLSNVWSDADRSQVRAISNELSAMALGEDYELPRKHKETKIGTAIYDAYTGEYSGKDKFAIAREGDRLVVQIPPGQTVFEIVPESTTQFFWKGREYYLTFVKDDNGKVTQVVIRNEGETGRWKKTR
jgi:CubicO group peptidase (beta-lactamase class C family)